jgi:shikimate kinase
MDALLVKRFKQSIPDYVAMHGWDTFRDAESALVEELSDQDRLVIDCGGGVIVRDRNIENLRRTGYVIWLQASVDNIAQRIGGDTQRPSLTGTKTFIEEISEVLTQRAPLYRKAADWSIDTDCLAENEVALRIMEYLKPLSLDGKRSEGPVSTTG